MKTIYIIALGLLLYFSSPTMAQVVFHTQNEYKRGTQYSYVTAEDFRNVVAAQFTVTWPKDKLKFKDLSWNKKLELSNRNFNLNRAEEGHIMFVWVDAKLQPKFFEPCDTILKLEFTRLDDGEAEIKIADEPTAVEIVSSNNEILDYELANGVACGNVTDSESPSGAQSLTTKIYPNPTDDKAIINFSQSINGTLIVTGHDGKRHREEDFTGSQYVFERNGLSSGLYMLQIMEGEQVIHRDRIIIE